MDKPRHPHVIRTWTVPRNRTPVNFSTTKRHIDAGPVGPVSQPKSAPRKQQAEKPK